MVTILPSREPRSACGMNWFNDLLRNPPARATTQSAEAAAVAGSGATPAADPDAARSAMVAATEDEQRLRCAEDLGRALAGHQRAPLPDDAPAVWAAAVSHATDKALALQWLASLSADSWLGEGAAHGPFARVSPARRSGTIGRTMRQRRVPEHRAARALARFLLDPCGGSHRASAMAVRQGSSARAGRVVASDRIALDGPGRRGGSDPGVRAIPVSPGARIGPGRRRVGSAAEARSAGNTRTASSPLAGHAGAAASDAGAASGTPSATTVRCGRGLRPVGPGRASARGRTPCRSGCHGQEG